MVELEIDMNQRIGEWATIQEAGTKLVPLYGPGYTGLANLGNSCYLNSVIQVTFMIPDFIKWLVIFKNFFFAFFPLPLFLAVYSLVQIIMEFFFF